MSDLTDRLRGCSVISNDATMQSILTEAADALVQLTALLDKYRADALEQDAQHEP